MKNTMALLGMGLAAILFSTASFAQETPDEKEPKKTRHIKMIKIENGKKMELDTVLAGNDVFIWNGDTLNPAKHMKKISPSGFGKMHQFDVNVDHIDGKEKVMIYKHKIGKQGDPMTWHMDSGNDVQIFSEEDGDSVQKKIIIRKRMKDGNEEDQMIFLNGPEMKHFPPMPPMPPMPHMKMMKRAHSGTIIDLNDPNIISYKKKKLSGGREKIEIIRNNSQDHKNMTYNFEFDDSMMVPEPPEPPAFLDEFDSDGQGKKMIKKEIRVEEKNGEKNKEENSPQENK